MRRAGVLMGAILLMSHLSPIRAQQSAATNGPVPTLVNFGGVLTDVNGKSFSGVVGVTFFLYRDQEGGAPLWIETQNVRSDKNGHYTVTLGSTASRGLPSDIFVAGEPRWLGVQPEGQPEQPRVMLVSVPYALKAADAETLGGKPLSAFQLATPQSGIGSQTALSEQANEIRCSGSANCKTGFIPAFSSNGGSATVTDSIMKQTGTSIGIAGSLAVTGNLNASSGQVLGETGFFRGTNNGAIFQATQNSSTTGAAIAGLALGTGGVGIQGSGITGVTGFGLSNGTGVAGTGGTGVFGQGGSSGFTQGLFGLSSSPTGIGTLSIGVGKSKVGTSLFGCCAVGVWGDTNQSTAGAAALVGTADDGQGLVVANNSTNQLAASIKNFENTTHNVQILNATGAFGSCNMDSDGNLGCTGRIRSQNLAAAATASDDSFASSGQCLGALTSANSACDTPNMILTETTANVSVLITANLNGVEIDACVRANFAIVMDGQIVTRSVTGSGGASFPWISSVTMESLQNPAPGIHTFEVQESDDTGGCGDTKRTRVSTSSGSTSATSTRTLIVREL